MIAGERNFRIHGHPPYRVVLLHGGPGAIGYLAPVANEISSAEGVIEAFQTKNTIEGLLDELNGIILQQAGIPVILCGHSWGAWLATMFTSRNPGLVGKLILVASGPFEENYILDYNLYQSVWNEAEKLRSRRDLLDYTKTIKCPVLAIHGDYDPHPSEGVRIPLGQNIRDFRFHLLEKCGHEPWTEKHARNKFFSLLKKELCFT